MSDEFEKYFSEQLLVNHCCRVFMKQVWDHQQVKLVDNQDDIERLITLRWDQSLQDRLKDAEIGRLNAQLKTACYILERTTTDGDYRCGNTDNFIADANAWVKDVIDDKHNKLIL